MTRRELAAELRRISSDFFDCRNPITLIHAAADALEAAEEDTELLDWYEANPRLVVASTGYLGAKDSWCWRDKSNALSTHEAKTLREAIKAARKEAANDRP